MLLLHPVPTSADAGPDLCTLCPDLCTLCPDLWTLCLWCFPSFNWCKYSTCTGGGCHQLQLALVVLFHSATSADSPLANVVVSPSATCAGGAFSSSHWRKYCTCTRATCTVWWYMYIIYILLAVKPIFDGLLCYGALSTTFRRKRSDASVSTKALLMSAMLKTGSWATEVRSCPWPQCDSASG